MTRNNTRVAAQRTKSPESRIKEVSCQMPTLLNIPFRQALCFLFKQSDMVSNCNMHSARYRQPAVLTWGSDQ